MGDSGLRSFMRFLHGRAEDLTIASDIDAPAGPLGGIESGSVDTIAMAFGIGYLADQKRAFREMRRVLRRPTGRICILDFALPAGEAPGAKIARELLMHLAPFVAMVASLASPSG